MRALHFVTPLLLIPGIAAAHIHLTNPLSRTDNTQGDPQKTRGCGDPTVTRITARVQTYHPGDTITVTWVETIQHPGWFRISFQPNGETFRIPPASNGPAGNGQPSNYPTEDLTGMMDATTGTFILKDRIGNAAISADITFPNLECDNCTLQLISVMTDKAPYSADTQTDALAQDIYYQCADIALATNAPDAGTGGMPDGGDGSGNGNNGTISGGCSTGGTTGLPVALALLGLIGMRRSR